MGLWMVISAVLRLHFTLAILPALACTFLPVIYSYLLYRKESEGKEE
jgi:hypothetical protein